MPDSNINPTPASEKVALFRGVQKYLYGAVIVGQSVAICALSGYVVQLQNSKTAELRQFLEYFMEKNTALESDLKRMKESNTELTDKTNQALNLVRSKPSKNNKK